MSYQFQKYQAQLLMYKANMYYAVSVVCLLYTSDAADER